jgi:hypothetical protein
MHLLGVLQGQAANIPAGAVYEDTVRALKSHYGDHQLAATYQAQLKARTQLTSKSLQDLAAATEQLTQRVLAGLPVDFIQREAAHEFIDGMRDWEVKQHLLMGGDRSLNEALNQDMKLEVKAAAGTPARLTMRQVTTVPVETLPPPADSHRDGQLVCWQCGNTGHLADCQQRPDKEVTNN